ncbi:MAG: hypothetical protein K2K14_04060 [Ruminococcus sp.]|nr:hypothetical protein [Ruminococcus sp.]
MKKSVYSLVLMDSVIKAVDEQAYRLGTSRSNLINQILAEQLCCVTPEMRMREIFDSVMELTGSNFQVQQQRSASLMTLRTALEYKYRPAVNYKVELEREPDNFMGRIRVHIRTQSQPLIAMFNSFFIYRINLEKKCLSDLGYDDYVYELCSGSFTRKLINSDSGSKKTGMAISLYLTHLNKSLQLYFSSPEDFPSYIVEKEYRELLEKFVI